jgi:hypothetical protein
MSDILSRLQQQSADFGNIAQRGEEMVQGFDSDRLIAQGQTLAYHQGKAQLEALVGQETVAGLTHGVPVVYKTGKAIAQRLSGMPTQEQVTARAQQATQQVAQRVKSAAQPLTENISQETSSGAAGDFLKYDVARGVPVTATGEDVGNDYFDGELQTPSGIRGDPVLRQARLDRLNNPPDPSPSAYQTVPDRRDLSGDWKSSKAPTESEFRAETERRRVAQASKEPPAPQSQASGDTRAPEAPEAPEVPTPSPAPARSIGFNQLKDEVPAPETPQRYPQTRGPAEASEETSTPSQAAENLPDFSRDGSSRSFEDISAKYGARPEVQEAMAKETQEKAISDFNAGVSKTQAAAADERQTQQQTQRLANIRGDTDQAVVAPQKSLPTDAEYGLPDLDGVPSGGSSGLITGRTNLQVVRDFRGPPSAPESTFNADNLFPAPPEEGYGAGGGDFAQTTSFGAPPTAQTGPPPPQDISTNYFGNPTGLENPSTGPSGFQFDPQDISTNYFGNPTGLQNPDQAQGNVPADLQARLKGLTVQDGDESGGGSQPTQEPTISKPGGDDESSFSKTAENIGKAEAEVGPEEEIADAIPGLGELIGGAIGLGALISGIATSDDAPKAPPKQPPGMPAMQTAYDSAPVIDSDNYHSL